MRRKLSGETVQRLRRAEKSLFVDISRQCARFALDHGATIAAISPELPDQLSDRQQDNWEPLFAIAQLAGPAWLEKANHAALTLSQTENEESVGVQLLEAIREAFESENVDKLSTADLIEALCKDEEACWASYYRDKAITARQLGRLLKPFSIQSRTTKFNGKSLKGYFKADFEDVFQRYLPPLISPEVLPLPRNSAPEPMPVMGSAATDTAQPIRNAQSPIGNRASGDGDVPQIVSLDDIPY